MKDDDLASDNMLFDDNSYYNMSFDGMSWRTVFSRELSLKNHASFKERDVSIFYINKRVIRK